MSLSLGCRDDSLTPVPRSSGETASNVYTVEQYTKLLSKYEAARRHIAQLEGKVALLRQQSNSGGDKQPLSPRSQGYGCGTEYTPSREEFQQVIDWNKELVSTVETQRCELVRMDTENKLQVVMLNDELKRLQETCARLQQENDRLKSSVVDDILQRRRKARAELATERSRRICVVRAAGRGRLEQLEGVLMASHDDMYFQPRFDSLRLPLHDATFVVHTVASVTYPLRGTEGFTMGVYHELLKDLAVKHNGHHVCFEGHLQVFVFYCATHALRFAGECHSALLKVDWPARTIKIPHFAPVTDFGELIYSGPRIHTCLYTCSPGVEVDPITGSWLYYGKEVRDALVTTLEEAPVGEIVANKKWCSMFSREHDITNETTTTDHLTIQSVRAKLGAQWSIVPVNDSPNELFCSILPAFLERRRGIPPYMVDPVPRFARKIIDVKEVVPDVIGVMKGVGPVSLAGATQQGQQPAPANGWVDHLNTLSPSEEGVGDKVLSLLIMKNEKDRAQHEWLKLQEVSAYHERVAMEGEDRYIHRFRPIMPGQPCFVCTVDIGENEAWQQVIGGKLSVNEKLDLHDRLHCEVVACGDRNDGLYVNGNSRDVVTFAFHQACQALRFAAQAYASVSKSCELKKTTTCIVRAGIAVGEIHTIGHGSSRALKGRTSDDGEAGNTGSGGRMGSMRLCAGVAVTLSAKLCDIARGGEIIASAGVVDSFYTKKSNVISDEYNILRYGVRFLGEGSTLTDIYSILPKEYAYRRQQQMGDKRTVQGAGEEKMWRSQRSVKEELVFKSPHIRRVDVQHMLVEKQGFLERNEAAMMALHDAAWHVSVRQAIRVPWLFTQTSRDATKKRKLGFLFCAAAGLSALSRLVTNELYKELCGQYNSTVQEVALANDGYVVNTDSISSYIIAFNDAFRALEAALQIDSKLLALQWPEEILTLAPTLRVKSARTGVLLFSGIRATTVVHASDGYEWNRVQSSTGEDSGIEISGPAISTLMDVSYRAIGGEAALTQAAHESVESSTRGRLLLKQLAMEVAEDNNSKTEVLYAPRHLRERLKLFSSERATSPAPAGTDRRSKTPKSVWTNNPLRGDLVWWMRRNGFASQLPTVHAAQWAAPQKQQCRSTDAIMSEYTERVVDHFKQELATNLYITSCGECFFNVVIGVLVALSGSFGNLSPSRRTSLPSRASSSGACASSPSTWGVLDPALTMSMGSEGLSRSSGRRDNRQSSQQSAADECDDPYKYTLTVLNETLKHLLQQSHRVLGINVSFSFSPIKPNSQTFSPLRGRRNKLPLLKR
ncbi:uncharacterized protein TEOVI_000466600 [Trypanosoma equiperdum]|uniref:Adenylyl cyclase n=2 Tax=Trypanozoon TaxID=39700 RepID=Q583X6_TRYB2|nr:hypothetical protein, conserved [Trypanosoma brucei brucei TREU927]AAX79820.1 hypothetical protein, conserved [Trypanosoma brucei]AAZ10890.1 hypothetical protein, conserved [Trypanosoma brucei brucei TREU927]SCU67079.1 hypothetical protein, conserved [Trypanosoma equiperdum]